MFTLDSYTEFKQTRKFVCKGVTAAKYSLAKGYFRLKFLLGSTNYGTRAVSNMAYSVGQTPTEWQTLRAKQETVKGSAQERKKPHLPTVPWL